MHHCTEGLTSAGRSMSARFGASPGASGCVNIVTEVICTNFPYLFNPPAARAAPPPEAAKNLSPDCLSRLKHSFAEP